MNLKKFAVAAAAGTAALVGAQASLAQTPAAASAPAAAPAITHGPPLNGVCTFSDDQVVGTSTVGKYVVSRLQQLGQQANAELTGEQTALQNDARALEGQRATLDATAYERRVADLQVRDNALQRKAQQRQREMQATEQKALGRVYNEMEPFIRQAYQAKGCSLLLNRQGVLIANPAMDISQQVTTALNAKITQFPIERERLDQPAAPTPAAPAK